MGLLRGECMGDVRNEEGGMEGNRDNGDDGEMGAELK